MKIMQCEAVLRNPSVSFGGYADATQQAFNSSKETFTRSQDSLLKTASKRITAVADISLNATTDLAFLAPRLFFGQKLTLSFQEAMKRDSADRLKLAKDGLLGRGREGASTLPLAPLPVFIHEIGILRFACAALSESLLQAAESVLDAADKIRITSGTVLGATLGKFFPESWRKNAEIATRIPLNVTHLVTFTILGVGLGAVNWAVHESCSLVAASMNGIQMMMTLPTRAALRSLSSPTSTS